MSDAPRSSYSPRPDASPVGEVSALVTIYRRAIERYEEAKATEGSGGEDARKEDEHVSGKIILP